MGTTAQKLAAVAASKASVAAALTARGITPPTPFKDYGDAVRMLSRIWDAEVEFVESTGTQYIDTGIAPTPTTVLDCVGLFPNTTPGARFGSRQSASSNCFYVVGLTVDGADILRFAFGASGTGQQLQRYAESKPIRRFVMDAASKSASLEYADGTSGALSFSQQAFTGSYPIFLLAFNNAGTASFSITGTRISSCRILDGSTLVRDYIPVRVGSVGYLFDRVSGKLFGNAGTGAFVIGPDKT